MSNKHLTIGLIAVAIIAIGGYLFPQAVENAFGRVGTAFPNGICISTAGCEVDTAGEFTVGANGTDVSEIGYTATCELIGTNRTHTASTTFPYDCAVTGVASGDFVIAQLATSTDFADAFGGWFISAARPSTTAGFVTVLLYNATQASGNPSATGVGSTTNIMFTDI